MIGILKIKDGASLHHRVAEQINAREGAHSDFILVSITPIFETLKMM
jgi:hypothetical protein